MLGGGEGGFNPKNDVLVFSRTPNIKNYSAQPGFHNYIFHILYEPFLFCKVIIKCSNKLFIDIYKIKFHFRYLFIKKNTYLYRNGVFSQDLRCSLIVKFLFPQNYVFCFTIHYFVATGKHGSFLTY